MGILLDLDSLEKIHAKEAQGQDAATCTKITLYVVLVGSASANKVVTTLDQIEISQ